MTRDDDEHCGCRCHACDDERHGDCNSDRCLYVRHRKARERAAARTEAARPKSAREAASVMLGDLRVQFGKIENPESRVRLLEWARFVDETKELSPEVRDAKRRERFAEVFG